MSRDLRFVDAVRRHRNPLEAHLIDGLVAGRVGRREFVRHGSLLGLSLPFLGAIKRRPACWVIRPGRAARRAHHADVAPGAGGCGRAGQRR